MLQGYWVIELGGDVSVAFAANLFGDMGADVISIAMV